jgi:hypothetical protein
MIKGQIGPREDYTNVVIKISPADSSAAGYPVEMEIPGWRVFPPGRLVLDLDSLLSKAQLAEQYGQQLGAALFGAGSIGQDYSETLAVSQGRGNGVRVRLLVEAPDLQGLRWERIYQRIDGEWHPLGSTALTPFSRYVPSQQWSRPVPVTLRPLRILAVISSPADLAEKQLDSIAVDERQSLRDSFARLSGVTLTTLESGSAQPPTLDALRKALAEGYHFVHFLCHGARTPDGSVLLLEDAAGKIDVVKTARLVEAFKVVQAPPLFVFLTACESAARDRHDGFLPLGPALVEDGGVQAAVAMTEKVSMPTARGFISQFYTRLLSHGVVDLAVNEARALVQDHWDWGVPVLFSRLPDNQLIDFPISQLTDTYLANASQAFAAVDVAINAARLEEHGQELVGTLEELVKELSKSNTGLVKVATNFRRTGSAPDTFKAQFEAFYYDFKEYYDGETWVDEKISSGKIADLRARILPRLSPILNDAAMTTLRAELDTLSNADNELVGFYKDYLDQMNEMVEQVYAKLSVDQVADAIQLKRDYEAQISPGFQRIKSMLSKMEGSVGMARAA